MSLPSARSQSAITGCWSNEPGEIVEGPQFPSGFPPPAEPVERETVQLSNRPDLGCEPGEHPKLCERLRVAFALVGASCDPKSALQTASAVLTDRPPQLVTDLDRQIVVLSPFADATLALRFAIRTGCLPRRALAGSPASAVCDRPEPHRGRDVVPECRSDWSQTGTIPCPGRDNAHLLQQVGIVRDEFRRRPTLPGSLPPSTIGAGRLNFRVRDGNGCDPAAMITGNLLLERFAQHVAATGDGRCPA